MTAAFARGDAMAEELTKEHVAKPDSNSRSADATGGVRFGPPQKPQDLGSLGPYRVIRAIGRGGMGMVFLGVDPKLRRKVALKVMLPKFLAKSTARERFLREARALAAVKNDHVVTIYQVDEANGVPYLALDYLQGSTLEEFLRAGQPLSMSQMVHVAREVALGLAAAHEHGVIHRDVKPENIWLEAPDGRVKTDRLWPRPAPGPCDERDDGRHGARHAGVHEPRAGPRHRDRSALRSLQPRQRDLPAGGGDARRSAARPPSPWCWR